MMWTQVSYRCLVVLVSARFCSTLSEDITTNDGSLILSTQPTMATITSIRTSSASSSTALSTVSSQVSTESTSTSRPTTEITQCWPHKTSLCPENWYQVDTDTCILVIMTPTHELPSHVCNDHGSESVKSKELKRLKSCLIKILGELKGASNAYVVRLDVRHYVNVQTGAYVTRRGTYSVVCINKTLKPPAVSLFTLEVYSDFGWSLVYNRTDYITVDTSYADVILTCEAEGVPKPRVTITSESGDEIRSGKPFTLNVCSRAKVYTCTANNTLGKSQAHRWIRILSPLKVKFTANNSNRRAEIRSGDTVELRCSVDGCQDNYRVTITRNEHPIAETANYTTPFVLEITGVNCSHMGTYTCLAKSPSGHDVQETVSLEVKGCPVSLCESKDASREMSPILGDNVTFALCLMSSDGMKYSANDTKILVKFTRNPIIGFNWTGNITMYNIQVEDYRTHTVRIENSDGSLDVHFTLKEIDSAPTSVGQKAQGHEYLLMALLPVCFIILVFTIVGIVWYRVKGTRISRTRCQDAIDCGSGNDDNRKAIYVNVKQTAVGRMSLEPGEEQQQEAVRLQCHEYSNTTDLHGQESGRYITEDGQVYITVRSVNKQINKRSHGGKHPSRHKHDDEGRVEYINWTLRK